jgi:hypothetical protein
VIVRAKWWRLRARILRAFGYVPVIYDGRLWPVRRAPTKSEEQV